MFGQDEQICITLRRLEKLERKAKELKRAKYCIKRLRAENTVLKKERQKMKIAAAETDNQLRHNFHKRYGVKLLAVRLCL